MDFKHTQLDNGLTIIAEIAPAAASMAAGFFVQTGSRDETPEIAGLSHFLEHMIFKGTPRRSAAQVNLELDEIGANYNAGTSTEDTIYYGAALPEFQDRLLDVLCDIMRPSLRQEDFDVEKGVILEEIAMLDDVPQFRLSEMLMELHFANHPLGNSVRGTAESIRGITCQQMRDYFDRRYSPTNVVAVGTGRLDYDAFVAKIASLCSHWQPLKAGRDTARPAASRLKRVVRDANVTRQHAAMMSDGPDHGDPSRFAAMLLAAIIGDDTGSRLYYALVDPAIADEASMMYEALEGAGMFMTSLSADTDKAQRAVDIARSELERFQREGPTESEMTAAMNKIASSATLRGELPMGRLTAVGFDWSYRREYLPLDQQIARLLAVTPQEVVEVARRFDLTAVTTAALGPLETL